MDRSDPADLVATGDGDGLVAEADSEQWPSLIDAGGGKSDRNAGRFGRAWPRRDQQSIKVAGQCLADGDGIVALDPQVGAQPLQIVDEREGEAVEIVDNQDSGAGQCALG